MGSSINDRCLGKSGSVIGAMGVGTWVMGGPFWSGEGCAYPTGAPLGYGQVDDRESIRVIHSAIEMGISLFDTADAYGTGHAEHILGDALKGRRDRAFIATKFGNTYDSHRRELIGTNVTAEYIRNACVSSLNRLQTDWIDLYQLHVGSLCRDDAEAVADALDQLCKEGLIRNYAWSTDEPECAELFGRRPQATAVQFDMNVLQDAPAMLDICRKHEMACIIRQPLAMGFLSGRFSKDSRLSADDIRCRPPEWLEYFEDGGSASDKWMARLDSIKEILSSEGRTPVQGALAWIWARDDTAIPVPGIRTLAQAEENFCAREFGPLKPEQMEEIDKILGRHT